MKYKIILKDVNKNNIDLARRLQFDIFPNEKSPNQIEKGIEKGNPLNFIAFKKDEPIGIVGVYFQENLPEHALLNWFGVLKEYRGNGYGRYILEEIINFIKTKLKKVKFLTYYSSKKANKTAIKLYISMNFITKDYCNEQDIEELRKLNVKNDFVIGSYPLFDKEIPDFTKINLQIAEQIKELKALNDL